MRQYPQTHVNTAWLYINAIRLTINTTDRILLIN
jgi:hypothetical protein